MASQKEQLEELLASYVDGTLSEIDRRAVEAYLDGHPDLRRDINEAIADSRALQSMPHVSAPAGLIDSMQQHVEREALLGDAKSSGGIGRNYALPKFAIAAMLLAGLGVGYFVFDKFYRQGGAKPIAIEVPKESGSRDSNTVTNDAVPGSKRELAEGFAKDTDDQSKLGPPLLATEPSEVMRQRSLTFRNIAQTHDRDLMNIPQSQLTQDGRVLMKLNVNTEVVEAAEMSLNGFVTDNQLQLTNANFIGHESTSNSEMTVAGAGINPAGDAENEKHAESDLGAMIESGGEWSQYAYFDKHKQSNQLRSLAMVRNIRVDQIDTLRQVVDRAPGSYPSTIVVIDRLESTQKSASTQPDSDWNELQRAAYRAKPGDRLRVSIDDPESQEKSEQILTVNSDGTLEDQNLNVKDKDVVGIETAIANQLQLQQAEQKSLPRVQVDPIEPMAESVDLEPEQLVDLFVVIEGPAPLPPATAPTIETSETDETTPTTQPSESGE